MGGTAAGDTAAADTVPGEGIEVDIVLAGSLPVAAFADSGDRPRYPVSARSGHSERRLLGEGRGHLLER